MDFVVDWTVVKHRVLNLVYEMDLVDMSREISARIDVVEVMEVVICDYSDSLT